jgi:hypothetical protein
MGQLAVPITRDDGQEVWVALGGEDYQHEIEQGGTPGDRPTGTPSTDTSHFTGEPGTAVSAGGNVVYGGTEGHTNITGTISQEQAKAITEQKRYSAYVESGKQGYYVPFEGYTVKQGITGEEIRVSPYRGGYKIEPYARLPAEYYPGYSYRQPEIRLPQKEPSVREQYTTPVIPVEKWQIPEQIEEERARKEEIRSFRIIQPQSPQETKIVKPKELNIPVETMAIGTIESRKPESYGKVYVPESEKINWAKIYKGEEREKLLQKEQKFIENIGLPEGKFKNEYVQISYEGLRRGYPELVTGIVTGIVIGASRMALRPIETLKSGLDIPRQIITGETAGFQELGRKLEERPLKVIGQLYGEAKGMSMVGIPSFITRPIKKVYLKLSPAGVAYKQTGIRIVEGTTIPTRLEELKKFEATRADTIHTTLSSEIGYGTILKPGEPGSVGAGRTAIGQYNFYQSLPAEKPVAYGGYVGLGSKYSAGERIVFSLIEPTPKAIIFRGQEISITPASVIARGIKETVKYQTETPGTYIPAENIFRRSIERQATTSVGTTEKPIFQLEANIQAPLYEKFTYYELKKPLPSVLGGKPKGLKLAEDIIKNPQVYVKKDFAGKFPKLSEEMQIVLSELKGEDIFITGGLARRIATGKGKVRDLDIVTNQGKEIAERIATKYPEKFEVLQHEKYPEIYRLRSKSTGKVFVDFDPVKIAEEGLLKKKFYPYVKVDSYNVVRPEVLLESKALQIKKGKVEPGGKQYGQIEQLTGVKNIQKTLQSQKIESNRYVKKVWDFLTTKDVKIKFMEAKLKPVYEADIKKAETEVSLRDYTGSYGKERYITSRTITESISFSGLSKKSSIGIVSKPSVSERVISSEKAISSKIKSISSREIISKPSKSNRINSVSSSLSSIKSSISKSSSETSKATSPSISSKTISSPIKSVSSSVTKSSTSKSISSSPKPPEEPPPTIIKKESKKKIVLEELIKKKKSKKAFIAKLKRKGKFMQIGKPGTKEAALDIGTRAVKETLGATFKIEEIEAEPIARPTGEFARSKGMLREYAIRRGQKVALKDTFIQKRKFRLSSRSEVKEIQRSRRLKWL